jgi:hypothetical protein
MKDHLTDSSCPKIPVEMPKKVLNIVEERRASHHLLNSEKIDWCSVSRLGSEQEGTVPCNNDQEPSNAMHMRTSEKCAVDEVYKPNSLILADPFISCYSLLPRFQISS